MNDPSLPRQAVLIVNARSRKGRKLFRRASRGLKAAGVDLIRSHAVRDPAKLKVHVCEAVAEGAPMVIVGGGDGSLSSSVDHLVGHDTVFALLPLGTANSFARTLGIPLDLDGAIQVIATGKRRRIDLGMIDDDYYANCATLGIAPLIAETVPHGLKRVLGRPGYLAWALYQMTRFKPFRLTIGEGATAETLDALEVRIANGTYHGGSELVDSASVDSGEIVVQVVTGRARAWLAWSWLASILRLDARRGTLREFHGREIRIATDRPMPVSIDGELLAKTPFTARIARAVIEVAVPA
ncbi:MAG TPA: YegS/Rv2252/BmrU family lipid kinase [Sphingomonas sp.]|uniref:YegS/Rv2252/BmrU family lipid kinase n=1 Tax=Sphingomonas sp. TaxID=28214 RepID=UPI002EDB581A